MVIRLFGVLLGAGFLILTFATPFNLRSLVWIVMGLAFLGYGIGGQRLLEKVAPRYSEKHRKKPGG